MGLSSEAYCLGELQLVLQGCSAFVAPVLLRKLSASASLCAPLQGFTYCAPSYLESMAAAAARKSG